MVVERGLMVATTVLKATIVDGDFGARDCPGHEVGTVYAHAPGEWIEKKSKCRPDSHRTQVTGTADIKSSIATREMKAENAGVTLTANLRPSVAPAVITSSIFLVSAFWTF